MRTRASSSATPFFILLTTLFQFRIRHVACIEVSLGTLSEKASHNDELCYLLSEWNVVSLHACAFYFPSTAGVKRINVAFMAGWISSLKIRKYCRNVSVSIENFN